MLLFFHEKKNICDVYDEYFLISTEVTIDEHCTREYFS